MAIKDYSDNPDMNTTISGINIAEGCAPSGINDAIRQLMADVKEESEAQGQAVSDIDAALEALRALIAEEVAKCLKLSGGRLNVGTGISLGTHDGIYDSKESGNTGIGINANSPSGRGAALVLRDIDAGGAFAIGARDASVANYLFGFPDGRLTWIGKSVLTEAGGVVQGELLARNVSDFIRREVNNDRLVFLGGPNWERCAFLELFGGDNSGRVQLNARDGKNTTELAVYPDGRVTLNGYAVLTSAHVAVGNVSGNSFKLPAGGTWAYTYHRNTYSENFGGSGTAAGGTTITTGEGPTSYFAIRIA